MRTLSVERHCCSLKHRNDTRIYEKKIYTEKNYRTSKLQIGRGCTLKNYESIWKN